MEADGLWIRLQRESKNHYELKNAIAYEGWERHPDDSYSLINKYIVMETIISHSGSYQAYILINIGILVNLIVLGGDDADWINAGESEMGYCVRHLSGFHLLLR